MGHVWWAQGSGTQCWRQEGKCCRRRQDSGADDKINRLTRPAQHSVRGPVYSGKHRQSSCGPLTFSSTPTLPCLLPGLGISNTTHPSSSKFQAPTVHLQLPRPRQPRPRSSPRKLLESAAAPRFRCRLLRIPSEGVLLRALWTMVSPAPWNPPCTTHQTGPRPAPPSTAPLC